MSLTLPGLSSLGLPGQLLNLLVGATGHHAAKPAASSKSHASNAANFSGVLNGALAAGQADPLAQLKALIDNGTPISTIVDQLANQIADAVQKRMPSSQLGSGATRTSLVNSIKTALSPPSNAPPGKSAEQVAALEQRLQRWLEGLSGIGGQQVGQQSDISGKILDANSARELPAQTQGSKSTPVPTGAASLALSLLKSTAASLTHTAAGTADPNAPANAATKAASAAAATLAQTGNPAPAPAPPAAPATAGPNVSAEAQSAAASSVARTPGDLVARMLIRAAGVDAQHNATLATVQAAAPSAQVARSAAASTAASSVSQSPAATAAKMTMLLTQAVNAAAQASSERSAQDDATLRDQANAAASAAPAKTTGRTDTSAFSLPNVSAPIAQTPSQAQAAATQAVDPTAAVEQLVKSMAMRTGSDGTSEMRLRLQPASLGTVTLKLTVDGNNVSANVVAQNGEVRSALLAHQGHLARSLADSGLKLTSFTVDLSGGHAKEQAHHNASGFGRRYAVHETAAAAEAESHESSSVGPALLPSSTLGLLSYLA
jgi:flagellar hook-length control protein FliK